MIERWADWATETVGSWPDDLAAAPPDWHALETHLEVARAHLAPPDEPEHEGPSDQRDQRSVR
jgi:hypothetical protein